MKLSWYLLTLLTLLLTACAAQSSYAAQDGKLHVVATTGQVADAVRQIAGDAVYLTGLLGPGVDPHLYVPTESDVTALSQADVIFYNGLHLEAQMVRVLEQMQARGLPVVAVAEHLPEDHLLNWAGSAPYDPHVWNDPALWALAVETIRNTLIELDPANANLYTENTQTYLQEIAETDAYVRAQIEKIPPEQRVLITAHDAFGYFARAYGMEVYGLQGISTESEASTAEVQMLAELIASRGIPAIFVETSVPARTIEAVRAAAQAQGAPVEIGGALFSDALGDPDTPAGTYTGMLRHNVDTIVRALTGSGQGAQP